MSLNIQQRGILYSLLQTEDSLSSAQIGKNTGLTSRKVRYNLTIVRKWLEANGVELNSLPRKGFRVIVDNNQRGQLINLIDSEPEPRLLLANKNRLLFLLIDLLKANDKVSAYYFDSLLSVSHNTLDKKLEMVREELKKYDLILMRQKGVGTWIEGDEIKHRHALISTMVDEVDEGELLDLCMWNMIRAQRPHDEKGVIKKKILIILRSWELYLCWQLVRKLKPIVGGDFVEADMIWLSIYIAVMQYRYQHNHRINLDACVITPYKSSQEFHKFCKVIINHNYLTHEHSDSELVQLYREFCTLSRKSEKKDNLNTTEEDFSLESIYDLAKDFIDLVAKRLNLQVRASQVALMFAEHMQRSLSRLTNRLSVHNPLTAEVRQTYPEIMNAVNQVAIEMKDRIGIDLPEDEIAYLTMYVAMGVQMNLQLQSRIKHRVVVVCPSGGITLGMLVFRLGAEIPEIDIVNVLSIRELMKLDLSRDADVVITTAQSLAYRHLPVISVSPLLNSEELVRIKVILKKIREDKETQITRKTNKPKEVSLANK